MSHSSLYVASHNLLSFLIPLREEEDQVVGKSVRQDLLEDLQQNIFWVPSSRLIFFPAFPF